MFRNSRRLSDVWLERYQKHGKFSYCQLLSGEYFVGILDHESIDYVLRGKFKNYEKGERLRQMFLSFLGNGIFNADGPIWKKQRQVASHMFSTKELKGFMFDVFQEHSNELAELLKENDSQVIDIQNMFQKYAFESIGRIAFDTSFGSLKELHAEPQFTSDFDRVNELTTAKFFDFRYQIFGMEPAALTEKLDRINKFCYSIIKERKEELARTNGKSERMDLLTRYMCSKDENGQDFSDEYLRDIAVNFIIAGKDTVSQLLTWSFYLLSEHPEKEEKLLHEIEQFSNKPMNYDTIKDMKYLRAVLDETLRLWPPVPYERKVAMEDDHLPNGIFIPKGTIVAWSTYALGRMEEYWDNPTEFRPERWFEQKKVQGFFPFLGGPRLCLGQNMAYLEASIAMATLLPKFKFIHPKDHVATYERAITLKAKYGMLMKIEKRQ